MIPPVRQPFDYDYVVPEELLLYFTAKYSDDPTLGWVRSLRAWRVFTDPDFIGIDYTIECDPCGRVLLLTECIEPERGHAVASVFRQSIRALHHILMDIRHYTDDFSQDLQQDIDEWVMQM